MIIIKRTAVVAGAVLHFIDGVHDYVDLLLFLLGLSLSPPRSHPSRSILLLCRLLSLGLLSNIPISYHRCGWNASKSSIHHYCMYSTHCTGFSISLNNHNNNSRVVLHVHASRKNRIHKHTEKQAAAARALTHPLRTKL